MTKNEFRTLLEHTEELIEDINDIFDKIIRDASLSQNEEDVEDLQSKKEQDLCTRKSH